MSRVHCILKEDLNSVGIEKKIVMACLVDREGQAVHGLSNCFLEPGGRLMDRTEVLAAREVDTTFAKVAVQLTMMRETKLLISTVLGTMCPVKEAEPSEGSCCTRFSLGN